ncbi:MAG TPA: hypothetical protein VGZ29_07265 [Terriglobia bacterium]|nr:hypothetical protein [Terriglobia bacterium]
MGNFQFKVPELVVTNPILLWLFNHGWEDPEWGKSEANQLTLALAINQLAARFTDAGTRAAIQGATAKAVAGLSQKIVAGGVAARA